LIYNKPPLTYEEQSDLLLSRGLIADEKELICILKNVNYYRLSAYLYPFRTLGNQEESFKPGTTLDKVWNIYNFDRQLRILVMDAIERVEVGLRTQMTYQFSHLFGPFGYIESKNLPKLDQDKFEKWLFEVREETKRSKETFVDHFRDTYGDNHKDLPIWMMSEIISFGKLLTFFNGVPDSIKKDIARYYGIEDLILKSWIGTLNVIRNICAHHGRLWNRELGFKPFVPRPKKYPEWHTPFSIANNRIFSVLTILRYLLYVIVPQSHWYERLIKLLKDYPDIPLEPMGFHDNWQDHQIWKSGDLI
jgi:abortive infection bacteriophage resistance protein